MSQQRSTPSRLASLHQRSTQLLGYPINQAFDTGDFALSARTNSSPGLWVVTAVDIH